MNKTETLTLINGNFTNDEAREILMNMFSSKINFHTVKNWSSQERCGQEDEIAQKKIPALRNEIKKLERILAEAKANNKKIVLSSEINISILED